MNKMEIENGTCTTILDLLVLALNAKNHIALSESKKLDSLLKTFCVSDE